MKLKSYIQYTFREQINKPFLIVLFICLIAIFFILVLVSHLALSYEGTFFESFSYFLWDTTLVFLGIYFGSKLYTKDFTQNTLGKLLIPLGIIPGEILIYRTLSFGVFMSVLGFLLYFSRYIMCLIQDHSDSYSIHILMLIFSLYRSFLSLTISSFLGLFIRPLLSLIVTSLFSIISATFDTYPSDSIYGIILSKLNFLNPHILILEFMDGHWVIPSSKDLIYKSTWTLGLCMILMYLSYLKINRLYPQKRLFSEKE